MTWTTDTLQAELARRKKSALTPGEQQEALGYLQSKGWQGGEISDQHAQDIFYTADQRWPKMADPDPVPAPSAPGPPQPPQYAPPEPKLAPPPPMTTVQPTPPAPPPPPGTPLPPPMPYEGPGGNPPPREAPPPQPTQRQSLPTSQADARAAVQALYDKYGLTPGGQGVTDLDYWASVAVSSGDLGYILNRLEGNILGTGPDRNTPGYGVRRSGAAPSPTPTAAPSPSPSPQPTPTPQAKPRAITYKLPDAQQGSDVDAVNYLNAIAQQSYGRTLSPDDIAYAANLARQNGWADGQPVTGRIINLLLTEMDRVWGGQAGPSPAPTPTPTPAPTPAPPPPPTSTVPPGPQGPLTPTGPTVPGPTSPVPVPTPQIPPANTPTPPSGIWSDPNTKFLEDFINARLAELLGSRQDPALDQYARLMQGRIDDLQNPVASNWDRDRLLGYGRDLATNLATTPPPANAERDALLKYGRSAFSELGGDPYSQADLDLIQTQQIDPIERDRTSAKQRVIERLSQRGIGPDSGLYQSALLDVDRSFDALRAQAHGATALKAIDKRDTNRAQAINLGQILSGVTDQTNADVLGRQYQALDLGGNLSSITDTMNEEQQQRARELLGNAQGLTGITQGLKGEQDRMRSEALSLASLLADLPERRLQLAQSVANGTPPPEGLFNSFLNLLGIQQQGQQFQQQFQQGQTSQMQQGLGMLARTLAGIKWGGGGTSQAGPYASGYVGGSF